MEIKSSFAHLTINKILNNSILRSLIIAIFLTLFTILQPKEAKAQNFDPLISFSVESCTLDVALEKLLAEYDINVAFSKAELSKIRIEKYSCSYKSSEEVLADLLKGTNYGFRKIGKQYVIRKNKAISPENQHDNNGQEEPISEITKHKTETIMDKTGDTIRVFDTMQVIRTVMRYDTIVRYDSIVTVDTVFAIKYKGYEIKWPKFRDNGWFVAPSLAYGFATINETVDPTLAEKNISVSLLPSSDFTIAVDGGYKTNRVSFGIGLSYNSLRYRFQLDETLFSGDYYVNDTLDTYYVVHPNAGDTSYFYVLDSTYIPLETTTNSFRDVNRHDYLGISTFATFDMVKNAHFRLFLKAQATIGILTHAEGSTIIEGQFTGNSLTANELNSTKFTYQIGLGGAWKVANRIELIPEVYFRKTVGGLYCETSPINVQTHSIGLKLGLTYYF